MKFHALRATSLLLACALAVSAPSAHAGAACCVVHVAGENQPKIGVSVAHAQSHETVEGVERSFSQQGTVARLSWPVAWGLSVAASGGVPVRTELGGVGSGLGGWIAGAGMSWSHRFGDSPWGTGASVSVTRSEALLGGDNAWVLSELQATAHVERDLNARRSLYLGGRYGTGKAEWEHLGHSEAAKDDLHPAGFGGWRETWSEQATSTLEAGYGHGFLVSLGLTFPLR